MDKPRLAVVFRDKDLLRITPSFNMADDVVDLKLSFTGKHFRVEYVTKNGVFSPSISSTSEVSYHSSKQNKTSRRSAEFHTKEIVGSASSYPFKQHDIADLSKYGEFPVPICSIEIVSPEGPLYRPKPAHRTFNFVGEYGFSPNTVEIYFAGKDFDFEKWTNKWPTISCLSTLTPIDYVVEGVNLRADIEMLFSQGIAFPAIIPIVFSDFCLLCKPRYLPNVKENRIRFYQNLDYMEMLGIQPIQLIDDKTGIPISKIIYSYSRDLALQRSLGVSDLDLRTWELIFQTAVEDHREYLAQCKVFLFPIIDNR